MGTFLRRNGGRAAQRLCTRSPNGAPWGPASPGSHRATSTTWCWGIPRRSSAAVRSTPRDARNWHRPARITTAAAIRAGLGHAAAPAGRPDGTPRAAILASADEKERDVATLLFAIGLHGGELVVCEKGYAGRDFEHQAAERFGARILRPARGDEPGRGPVLSWIRQRIESIFFTLRDRLGLERHHARSLHPTASADRDQTLALAAGPSGSTTTSTSPRAPSQRSPPNPPRNQSSSGRRRAPGDVPIAGTHDDRTIINPVKHLHPASADDRRRARAALDRGPVRSDGRADTGLASHLPTPWPAARGDAYSVPGWAGGASRGRGAAGRLEPQHGGHIAPRCLVDRDRAAGHVGARVSSLPRCRRQADRAVGRVERRRRAPPVAAAEHDRVAQRHAPVHRGQPELGTLIGSAAAVRVDVDASRARRRVARVVDLLTALRAAPHHAIAPVDDRQVLATAARHRLVTRMVAGDDDIRVASAVETIHAGAAVEVVLARSSRDVVRATRAGDRVAPVAALDVLDLVDPVAVVGQAGTPCARVEPDAHVRLGGVRD